MQVPGDASLKLSRVDQTGLKHSAELMLTALGMDLTDPNIKDTPDRIARLYREIFITTEERDSKAVELLSKRFPSSYGGMVISGGIRCYSVCCHHFLPTVLDVVIGYIPGEYVLGLSKLARLAELYAKQPMIQETYTEELAKRLMHDLGLKGVGVHVRGVHFCQSMRGAKQQDAVMTTTSLLGCFKDDGRTRSEFLDEVARKV